MLIKHTTTYYLAQMLQKAEHTKEVNLLGVELICDLGRERGRDLSSVERFEVKDTEEGGLHDLLGAGGAAAQALVLVDAQQAADAVACGRGEGGRERRLSVDDAVKHELAVLVEERRPAVHHLEPVVGDKLNGEKNT